MICLHVHNSDSILDGLGTQLQNAEIAASLGQTALAFRLLNMKNSGD